MTVLTVENIHGTNPVIKLKLNQSAPTKHQHISNQFSANPNPARPL